MKTLSELSDAQRKALAIVDEFSCVFWRRSGWSARGSAIIQRQTMDLLVSAGFVRITEAKRSGFMLIKATLTDTGEVLAEQMRAKQGRRAA